VLDSSANNSVEADVDKNGRKQKLYLIYSYCVNLFLDSEGDKNDNQVSQNIQIHQSNTFINQIFQVGVNFFSSVSRSSGSSPVPKDDEEHSDRLKSDSFKQAADDIDNDEEARSLDSESDYFEVPGGDDGEGADNRPDSGEEQENEEENSKGTCKKLDSDEEEPAEVGDEQDNEEENSEGFGKKPDSDEEEPAEDEDEPDSGEEPADDEEERQEDQWYGKMHIDDVRSSSGFDSVVHQFVVNDEYFLYVARSGIFDEEEFSNDKDNKGVFTAEDIPSGAYIGMVEGDKIRSFEDFTKLSSDDIYFLIFNEKLGYAVLEYNSVKCPRYRFSKMAYAKRGSTIETNVEIRYDSVGMLEYRATTDIPLYHELVVAFNRAENTSKLISYFNGLAQKNDETAVVAAPISSPAPKGKYDGRKIVGQIFPVKSVSKEVIANQKLCFLKSVAAYGMSLLKSELYKSMIKNVETWPKNSCFALFNVVHQLSDIFDVDTLGNKVGGLNVLEFRKITKKMESIKKTLFIPVVDKVLSSKKYISFCTRLAKRNSLTAEEETNLEFRTIEKMTRQTWSDMDSIRWHNMPSIGGGFVLYVSCITTARIIYFIRKYFNSEIENFRYYADIGVGCPYLAASLQFVFSHVAVAGIDFPDVIGVIKNKILNTGGKRCAMLRSISFVAADVLLCDEFLVQDLKKCQVITNLVGITKVDEHIIKHILPRSSCRVIMFRSVKEFPKVHEEWLRSMGFDLEMINGSLDRRKEEKFYIRVYYRKAEFDTPVPDINPRLLTDKNGIVTTGILGKGREYKTLKFQESEKDFSTRVNLFSSRVPQVKVLTLDHLKSGLLPLLKTNRTALSFVRKLLKTNFPESTLQKRREKKSDDSNSGQSDDESEREQSINSPSERNDSSSSSSNESDANTNQGTIGDVAREGTYTSDACSDDDIIGNSDALSKPLSWTGSASEHVTASSSLVACREESKSEEGNPPDVEVIADATEIGGEEPLSSATILNAITDEVSTYAYKTPPSSPNATHFRSIPLKYIEQIVAKTKKIRLQLNGDRFASPDNEIIVRSADELVEHLTKGDITFSVGVKIDPSKLKVNVCKPDGTCAYQLAYVLQILVKLGVRDWPDEWWCEKAGEYERLCKFYKQFTVQKDDSVLPPDLVEKLQRVYKWATNNRTKNRILPVKDWGLQEDLVQLLDPNLKTSIWYNSKDSPEWIYLSWTSWLQNSVQAQCTVTTENCKKILQTRVVGIVQDWNGIVGNDSTRHFFPSLLPEFLDADVDEAISLLLAKLADLYDTDFNAPMPSPHDEDIVASRRTVRKRRASTSDKDVTPTSVNQSRRSKPNTPSAILKRKEKMKLDSDEKRRKTTSSSVLDVDGALTPADDTKISFHKAFIIQKDIERLRPEGWFNDSIIEFRLNCLYFGGIENHHLFNALSSEMVYIFSTQFYHHYRGKSLKSMVYSNVQRWTENVDIFEKRLLFIPIGYANHWSLVAICNAGLVRGEIVSLLTGDRAFTDESNDREKNSLIDCLPACILHIDSLNLHKTTPISDALKNYLDCEWRTRKQKTLLQGQEVFKDFANGLITIDCHGMVIYLFIYLFIYFHHLKIVTLDCSTGK